MVVENTLFEGLKVLNNFVSHDDRGVFVKTFNDTNLQKVGLSINIQESYYSISHQHVVRGMHFQLPPHDHEKLVYVTDGSILDVVVDLRKASATYQQVFSTTLRAHEASLFIPRGFAHGFLTLSASATVVYNVATGYQPTADAGVKWDSLNFAWPVTAPIISSRDEAFPALHAFQSPF